MIQQSHFWTYIWKRQKLLIQEHTCTPMFITALFTIAKQPKCSSIDERRKEMWYTAAPKWLQLCPTLCDPKWLQLCPTLCDPMNCSPPGSSVQRTLQTRILEWVANFLLQQIFLTQGSNSHLLHISSFVSYFRFHVWYHMIIIFLCLTHFT